jgi:hypothetical protein
MNLLFLLNFREPQYGFGRVEFLGNRLAYTRTEAAIIVQDIFSGKVK